MDFVVEDRNDGRGVGVYALRRFVRGDLIARISGEIVFEHRLHTLQLDDRRHLYDPSFTGRLLHSCEPNAVIYPQLREVRALFDIESGEAVTVDYAHTEDRLVRQFACGCGSANCRRWITGRRETTNAEGREYLTSAQHG
jgi:SET domain-containing protein